MANITTQRIKSITEFHRLRGLPPPEHPLISLVDYAKVMRSERISEVNWVLDFYNIAMKRGLNAKLKYGQQEYDFDEGIMFFIAPNQVFRIARELSDAAEQSGWMLLIHPDFLWNTALAKSITRYDFFDYTVNEALFVSEKEEATINHIVQTVRNEYHSNIDKFSKQIIISQIETLLGYADRFYHRQFITREKANVQVLQRVEQLLDDYFNSEVVRVKGLPVVHDIAVMLNMSPKYLSSLLKALTGQNMQQHIHDKIISTAKERLSTTMLSVGEIAYGLGFEHPQSFSKLFKSKTSQSPLAFRAAFK